MFVHHQKREKPNFIGECTAEFPFWADSFLGLIMRHWNLLHMIAVNRTVRLWMINALGINSVQQYRDEETVWSFLLYSCLHLTKAKPTIAFALWNKNHPDFCMLAWIGPLKAFDPKSAQNSRLAQNDYNKASNCLEAGKTITNEALLEKILETISTWASKTNTYQGKAWLDLLANTILKMNPQTLDCMTHVAEDLEDGFTFTESCIRPEIAPEPHFNNATNSAAYHAWRMKNGYGEDSLLKLTYYHLQLMAGHNMQDM
eukprot:906369-Rhodomonas_salina.1